MNFILSPTVLLYYCYAWLLLSMSSFSNKVAVYSTIVVSAMGTLFCLLLYVERVIGNIRQKYSILSSTQPIDFVNSNREVTTLDKIVCVTCALINTCNSVVPFD